MPAGHGLRSRTRDLFACPFRKKGYIPLSTYPRTYKIGDYVDIKVFGAIHKGMPHKFYHGRIDSVWNVTKRAFGVEINNQALLSIYRKAHGPHRHSDSGKAFGRRGLPSKHAKAVSLAISKAANATFEEVSANFVKKTDQEIYACNSQHEMDKARTNMDGLRSVLLNELNLMSVKMDKMADVTKADIATTKAELIAKLEGNK